MPQSAVIYLLGLGPGDPLDLPGRNLSLLKSGYPVYLRTKDHPLIPYLERDDLKLSSLDHFYEEFNSFEDVYSQMADFLIEEAKKEGIVVFEVSGNPLVGERAVQLLKRQGPVEGVRMEIFSAPGFLDSLYQLLEIDPGEGIMVTDSFQFFNAKDSEQAQLDLPLGTGIIVMQIYSRSIASEVKLTLMDYYPDEHRVVLVRGAGNRGSEQVLKIPLYELDRQKIDHLTSLYIPPVALPEVTPSNSVEPLVKVLEALLSTEGCPWDRQQTHQTLKKYLIEETYEVLDAIDEGDMYKLCEELGDLLLQIVFHSALAEEAGRFTMDQVVSGITEKMIRRHPHVFGETTVENADQVTENWELIKQKEGKDGKNKSLLAGVPKYLPALQRAQKVQSKAAVVGFDWPEAKDAALKVEEEWAEVEQAWQMKDQVELQQELGDLLFAVVNICRLLKFDAEETLQAAVNKFMGRFSFMEKRAQELDLSLEEMQLAQLEKLWVEAKKEEKVLSKKH